VKVQRFNFFGFVLLLAVFVVRPLGAQETRPAAAATRHSLWKVEGQHNTVYLLGSVHLLKKEDYPLAAPIEAAFTNAQIAVFETDADKMQDLETQTKIMSKAQLPEGETLKTDLSPQTYAAFTNHVAKAGFPPDTFDTLKPLIAATALEAIDLLKLGVDPSYGMDVYFFNRATKDGKQIMTLETVDFQIDLVTGFSKEEAEPLMKAELKDMDNTQKEYGEVVKAWQTGDTAKLEKVLNDAMHESPTIFKRLVTDRSQSWIPKIEELARGNKNAIIIVGAGHLVGKDGVVELLRKKGLKVTQQ
jgi:uncharacterized protein YbaP (TraB family)